MKILLLLLFILFLSAYSVAAQDKIYLIRHAPVNINKPNWCTAKTASQYKLKYNSASIVAFNPEEVLAKINNPHTIDTIFVSPQSRALQTSVMLFRNSVTYRIDSNLMELDYPVIQIPIVKLPVDAWLLISRISWMTGINVGDKPSYKRRLKDLSGLTERIQKYTERHGQAVIIAHGFVNREIIRYFKKNGWKHKHKDGFKNLSVNTLIKTK